MMANQIARNVAVRGEDAAIEAVADHLMRFWDPRMRSSLIASAERDEAALLPVAAAAVRRISAQTSP